ncbi:MAG TPA: YgaP-like transmembrane domain [Terriglobales bacterium]
MTLNVGGIDRLIRIVIELVLIALGVFHVVTGTAAKRAGQCLFVSGCGVAGSIA